MDTPNYCKINGEFASKLCLVPMQRLAASAHNRCQITQRAPRLPKGLNSQTGVGAWRRTGEPGWGPNKGCLGRGGGGSGTLLLDARTAVETPSGQFLRGLDVPWEIIKAIWISLSWSWREIGITSNLIGWVYGCCAMGRFDDGILASLLFLTLNRKVIIRTEQANKKKPRNSLR